VIRIGSRDTFVSNDARRDRSSISSARGRHTWSRMARSTMNEYHFRPAGFISGYQDFHRFETSSQELGYSAQLSVRSHLSGNGQLQNQY